MFAQQVSIDPQTDFVIVAGFGDAALGTRLTLLDVLLVHVASRLLKRSERGSVLREARGICGIITGLLRIVQ